MLCAECGSEMRRCTDPIKETFRGEEIMVTGIEHYLCDSCGEILFGSNEGKDFDAEILRQYALRENLLTPQEIKTIRKRNGLNQQDFEKVLGVSSPSISRWETGRVLQSKPLDLLMRAYDKEPMLLKERMKEKGIYSKANNIVSFPIKTNAVVNRFAFDADDQAKEG